MREDTAEKYDEVLPNYYFFDWESKKYIEETFFLKKYLADKKFSHALEFGVGTGRMTKIVQPHTNAYTGIDLGQSMVEKTQSLIGRNNDRFINIDINSFISQESSNFKQYDFFTSFWAYNYSLLEFFEYYFPETDDHGRYSDLVLAEDKAKNQIEKLFTSFSKNTEFLIYYFDAYSVEQSYVTSVLEKDLPFPYDDRGYTYKLLQKVLSEIDKIDVEFEHLNGFAKLKNTTHLLNYFGTLHLEGFLNTEVQKEALINHFSAYQDENGIYSLPAGLNVIRGRVVK